MGIRFYVRLPHRQGLNRTLTYAKSAPSLLEPRVYLRTLRCTLRMSQEDLARRAGTTQAEIAAIESGRRDPRLGTMRRLFDAMFCELLVAPKTRKRPTEALAGRDLETRRRAWAVERGA